MNNTWHVGGQDLKGQRHQMTASGNTAEKDENLFSMLKWVQRGRSAVQSNRNRNSIAISVCQTKCIGFLEAHFS